MKAITVKLTEDQIELLENISKMTGKSSADFIKETIFALLPFSEYAAIKNYLKSVGSKNKKKSSLNYINNITNNILASANARLRRIGVL